MDFIGMLTAGALFCLACNALVCILALYLVCKSKDDR